LQVGKKVSDHSITTGAQYTAEAIQAGLGPANMTRPVYILTAQTNGSDLVAEAVAAYASLSILFDKINPQLSVALEDDAFTMYELMNTFPNTKYSAADPEYNVRSNPEYTCCYS
jgi:Glycosyl hydrolase family 9